MCEPRPHPEPRCVGQVAGRLTGMVVLDVRSGHSEVSMVLSRGARRCTLATRALGPPTTWEEAATQPSLRRHAPRLPALTAAVNRISMICEVACRLQTLSGSAGPPGSSPGCSD